MKRPRALQAEGTLVVLKSRGEQAWEVSESHEQKEANKHLAGGKINPPTLLILPLEARGTSLLSFSAPKKGGSKKTG